MENRGIQRIGEDLVKIYDIPATTDRDPSGWVFWFFALFFSMIVADGGYGLMYLGLCIYLKYKYPVLQASARRFLKLATILATGCIIWGSLDIRLFWHPDQPQKLAWKIISDAIPRGEKSRVPLCSKRRDVYQFWGSETSPC